MMLRGSASTRVHTEDTPVPARSRGGVNNCLCVQGIECSCLHVFRVASVARQEGVCGSVRGAESCLWRCVQTYIGQGGAEGGRCQEFYHLSR